MPEPTPVLVDTIARAIYDDQHGDSPLSLSWDDAIAASRSDRHDAGLHGMGIGSARRAARAALAALPQPIGYAVAVHHSTPTWTVGGDIHQAPSSAEIVAARCRDGSFPNAHVVALVPVEDQ